jgi:CARDB protein
MSSPPNRPRPRRAPGSGTHGSASERQTILVRRAIAGGAALIALLLLILGVRGCLDARKDRAFRDYAADVRTLIEQSDALSDQLFGVLTKPQGADSLDIQNEINAQSTDAQQLVGRAKNTEHPDELNAAHRWVVTALEFRRDGLEQIAQRIPTALGERGRRPAIESIAGQMQAFLASDVIYSQRALPELQGQFKDRDISERFPSSRFLPDLGWLATETVDSRLSKLGTASRATTPGLHGSGLVSVSAKPAGTTLTEGGANRVAVSPNLTFDVEVQNQGESEETDVGVSVSIKNGKAVNVDQTISRIAAGDTQTVSIPISDQPSTGSLTNVTVEIASVPGEKKTDNNKATYQVVFTQG